MNKQIEKKDDVILRIKGISKTFGGVKALEDISFDVKQSEILGIIGPNGAGKTTLVNTIMGIYKPTNGEIWFNNKNITSLKTYKIARLGLSRTFQVVKPIRGMTVIESIIAASLFGNLKKVSLIEARKIAEETLELVSLQAKKDYYCTELNINDLKRLDLAKALSMHPKLLLLDEVMAGLNRKEIDTMMNFIQKINTTGVTVFAIEHIMKAIMGISHRIVVLHHGKKLSEGRPKTVSEDPEVIKAYLGKRYKTTERG